LLSMYMYRSLVLFRFVAHVMFLFV
jgi:hypothetical protein